MPLWQENGKKADKVGVIGSNQPRPSHGEAQRISVKG